MRYSGSVQVGVVARKFLPVSLKAEVHGDGDVAALARMGPADTPRPAKAATTQTVKSTWGLRKHGSYAKLRSASLSPEAFTEFSSEVSSGVAIGRHDDQLRWGVAVPGINPLPIRQLFRCAHNDGIRATEGRPRA